MGAAALTAWVAAVVVVVIVAIAMLGGRMTNDDGPRLRDIIVLILFAILLRIAESFDRDTPGWWREGEE